MTFEITSGEEVVREDGTVEANRVSAGAIVVSPEVNVRHVTSGGLVVATRVTRLTDVNSGGVVIAKEVPDSVRTENGGQLLDSVEPYIEQLESKSEDTVSLHTQEDIQRIIQLLEETKLP